MNTFIDFVGGKLAPALMVLAISVSAIYLISFVIYESRRLFTVIKRKERRKEVIARWRKIRKVQKKKNIVVPLFVRVRSFRKFI